MGSPLCITDIDSKVSGVPSLEAGEPARCVLVAQYDHDEQGLDHHAPPGARIVTATHRQLIKSQE
jgi:hypothetical protein